MIRTLGSLACITIALAMPMQEAAAQDPVGGAIVGGATGAIIGGVLGGGRGAAIGAIIGGATGAAIGAEGEPRPGGYRYYQDACYQEQPVIKSSPTERGSLFRLSIVRPHRLMLKTASA